MRILKGALEKGTLYILSDIQAAMKVLDNCKINSKCCMRLPPISNDTA
jgi:hypothetical protein